VVQPGRAGKVTVLTRVGSAFGRLQPFDAYTLPIPELVAEESFRF
jgi:hypothetical protein